MRLVSSNSSKWWSLPLMSVALVSAVYAAKEDPTTKPSDEKPAKSMNHWGFSPYNKLSNVSDDQKLKIAEIHRKAVAEIKAIEDKEDTDVMALLTDDQKAELEKLNAEKKAKAAEKRNSKKDSDDDKK